MNKVYPWTVTANRQRNRGGILLPPLRSKVRITITTMPS